VARIIIVGGSLGGLFAANLLLRAGHEVAVLEKSPSALDGRGAGIVTHPSLLRALRAAGAASAENLGVEVASRRVLDPGGAVAASLPLPQLLTSWARLYQILLELLPSPCYHRGKEVTALLQSAGAVSARCGDGTGFEGDLLLASDGLRSTVRAQLAPHVQPFYAGYVAWRGVCDEAALSEDTHASLFEHFGFCLPPGEQILGYPVAGAGNSSRRGERRYNFVWYRGARGKVLEELLTDSGGMHHPGGIPPNRIAEVNILRMRADARRLLAPQFVEVLEKTPQPFLQPICDVASEQLAFGRAALMGDAAFVARPHVGMGVTKAAEDALSVCECIERHGAGPEALLAYHEARQPVGLLIVERARELGAYMQAQGQPGQSAPAAPGRDARRVLEDTAIDFRPGRGARRIHPAPA
jgi:2-polyprenyl-6-methoxyphenol hydroxylase-like FAD-dependent oxidoreductase